MQRKINPSKIICTALIAICGLLLIIWGSQYSGPQSIPGNQCSDKGISILTAGELVFAFLVLWANTKFIMRKTKKLWAVILGDLVLVGALLLAWAFLDVLLYFCMGGL